MNLKQILVPVDFSTQSQTAVDRAAELAKTCGACLRVVHVCDVPPYVYSDTRTMMISGMNYQEYTIEETTRKTEDLCKSTKKKFGIEVEFSVREGAAGSEICEDAREAGVDLILMPTHGRTGVSRFLMGSVTEKVVRHASCPVLTFRADEDLEFSSMRKILVPLDLSDEANEALEMAADWATMSDGSIDLVHILDDVTSIPSVEWSVYPSEMPQEYFRAAEKRAFNSMEAAAAAEVQDSVPCQAKVRHGFVCEELIAAAKELETDLIIASTHGHSGFRKMVLGSVAERLVRTAPCPVLIVQPGED